VQWSSRLMPSNRFSTRPLYLQVRDALAQRIASAEWKPGGAIPNESDLAREFGVSSGTMRKALDLLETERLLTRRQGRGTFVNDQTSAELAVRYSNMHTSSGERFAGDGRTLAVTEDTANETECARLRLRPHDRIYRIRRLRMLDGEPFMLEDVAMPAVLFPGLVDSGGDFSHRIVVLAQQYGILLGKAEERINIAIAPDSVAGLLGVAKGSPLLHLDRVVLNLDGRPVEWRVADCDLRSMYYLAEMS
jgi:GntR family transcriptional regulator